MKRPDLYLTLHHCGRNESYAGIVACVRAVIEALPEKLDLLCYCHQTPGPVWEAPYARLRAELGIPTLKMPLVFGQSGCLSFPHAFMMMQWLLAAGPPRSAWCVIAEPLEGEQNHLARYKVAIVEVSTGWGAYQVVQHSQVGPALQLATDRWASEPFLAWQEQESLLGAGDVVALTFADGFESYTIQLRKQE